ARVQRILRRTKPRPQVAGKGKVREAGLAGWGDRQCPAVVAAVACHRGRSAVTVLPTLLRLGENPVVVRVMRAAAPCRRLRAVNRSIQVLMASLRLSAASPVAVINRRRKTQARRMDKRPMARWLPCRLEMARQGRNRPVLAQVRIAPRAAAAMARPRTRPRPAAMVRDRPRATTT